MPAAASPSPTPAGGRWPRRSLHSPSSIDFARRFPHVLPFFPPLSPPPCPPFHRECSAYQRAKHAHERKRSRTPPLSCVNSQPQQPGRGTDTAPAKLDLFAWQCRADSVRGIGARGECQGWLTTSKSLNEQQRHIFQLGKLTHPKPRKPTEEHQEWQDAQRGICVSPPSTCDQLPAAAAGRQAALTHTHAPL